MKADSPRRQAAGRLRRAVMLAVAGILAGCVKEDEEMQRQLVELKNENLSLRARLDATQPASPPAPSSAPREAGDAAELAAARSRIRELEKSLAAATSAALAPAGRSLDPQVLRQKAADRLSRELQLLGELISRQQTGSRIKEIRSPTLETPPEIAKPFRTVATFSLACSDGRIVNLEFPITADLEGSWTLPGPDTIQEALRQALAGATLAGPRASGPPPSHPAAPTGPSGFQRDPSDPNTFRFSWPEGPAPAAGPDSSARPAPPPVSSRAVMPPAPGISAPAAPQMAIPPKTMPVERDIIIRF